MRRRLRWALEGLGEGVVPDMMRPCVCVCVCVYEVVQKWVDTKVKRGVHATRSWCSSAKVQRTLGQISLQC
jgi:hypothetical protein